MNWYNYTNLKSKKYQSESSLPTLAFNHRHHLQHVQFLYFFLSLESIV